MYKRLMVGALLLAALSALAGCPKRDEKTYEQQRDDKVRELKRAEQRERERHVASRRVAQAEPGALALIRRTPARISDEACSKLAQQAKEAPAESWVALARGVCLEQAGKLDQAVAVYRGMKKSHSLKREAARLLTIACFRKQDLACWSKAYRRLALQGRYRARRVVALATCPPLKLYEPLVKAEAVRPQDVLVRKAINAARAGRLDDASRELQASLALDVNHLPTLINLALVNASQARVDKGLQYLDRARGLQAKQTADQATQRHLLQARALLYHRSGNLPAAEREYQALLKLKPDHDLALYGLGVAQSLQGKKNAALDTYARLNKAGSGRAARLFAIIMRDG